MADLCCYTAQGRSVRLSVVLPLEEDKVNKGGFGTRPYARNLILYYQCIINRIRDIDP